MNTLNPVQDHFDVIEWGLYTDLSLFVRLNDPEVNKPLFWKTKLRSCRIFAHSIWSWTLLTTAPLSAAILVPPGPKLHSVNASGDAELGEWGRGRYVSFAKRPGSLTEQAPLRDPVDLPLAIFFGTNLKEQLLYWLKPSARWGSRGLCRKSLPKAVSFTRLLENGRLGSPKWNKQIRLVNCVANLSVLLYRVTRTSLNSN